MPPRSKRAPRQRQSDELKAQVLAACDESGASVAAVGQADKLSTNPAAPSSPVF